MDSDHHSRQAQAAAQMIAPKPGRDPGMQTKIQFAPMASAPAGSTNLQNGVVLEERRWRFSGMVVGWTARQDIFRSAKRP